MKRLPIILLTALALTLLCKPFSLADEIVLRKGKINGVVAKRENGQVYVNTYNSKNVRMTRGVEKYAEKQIKKVVDTRNKTQRYLDKIHEHKNNGEELTKENFLERLKLALALGARNEAERLAFQILEKEEGNADALKVLSSAEWQRRKKADPRTNPDLATRLETWFETENDKKRKSDLSAIKFEFGFPHELIYMERVRRSRNSKKGRHNDVRLTLNSKQDKGVYTLFVPDNYDPTKTWPLVVGLHGGGPDGKDRKDVVGTGRSAMNFYSGSAARRGFIVVCPTAVNAPWNAKTNDTFVQSVIQEIQLLYNVDLNRVYLTGHSMGGFGTWHFGPRHAKQWAVVAPMAGGGFRTLSPFQKTNTPIYLYHGANDAVVGPSNSRQAADQMKSSMHDFIYTEIPDSGHGFPGDVQEEMWHMFETRRLAVAPKRADKGVFKVALDPFSSFLATVSKQEKLYFGAPGTTLPSDKKSLLARLKLGGGAAQAARTKLVESKDETVIASVGKLVANKKMAFDVRIESARVMGGLRSQKAVKPLLKALKGVHPDVVPAIARALGQIADRSAGKALAKTLSAMDKEFDKRLTGNKMAFSDWKRMLNAYAAIAKALTLVGEKAVHGSLSKSATKALLSDWEVRESDRAGLDKKAPLTPCALALVEALGATGNPTTSTLLDKIGQKNSGLSGLADAISEAKKGLN
ncbi:MAG: putative esterase [Planctomycetota bacterium]|jgi:predicted esterase